MDLIPSVCDFSDVSEVLGLISSADEIPSVLVLFDVVLGQIFSCDLGPSYYE